MAPASPAHTARKTQKAADETSSAAKSIRVIQAGTQNRTGPSERTRRGTVYPPMKS